MADVYAEDYFKRVTDLEGCKELPIDLGRLGWSNYVHFVVGHPVNLFNLFVLTLAWIFHLSARITVDGLYAITVIFVILNALALQCFVHWNRYRFSPLNTVEVWIPKSANQAKAKEDARALFPPGRPFSPKAPSSSDEPISDDVSNEPTDLEYNERYGAIPVRIPATLLRKGMLYSTLGGPLPCDSFFLNCNSYVINEKQIYLVNITHNLALLTEKGFAFHKSISCGVPPLLVVFDRDVPEPEWIAGSPACIAYAGSTRVSQGTVMTPSTPGDSLFVVAASDFDGVKERNEHIKKVFHSQLRERLFVWCAFFLAQLLLAIFFFVLSRVSESRNVSMEYLGPHTPDRWKAFFAIYFQVWTVTGLFLIPTWILYEVIVAAKLFARSAVCRQAFSTTGVMTSTGVAPVTVVSMDDSLPVNKLKVCPGFSIGTDFVEGSELAQELTATDGENFVMGAFGEGIVSPNASGRQRAMSRFVAGMVAMAMRGSVGEAVLLFLETHLSHVVTFVSKPKVVESGIKIEVRWFGETDSRTYVVCHMQNSPDFWLVKDLSTRTVWAFASESAGSQAMLTGPISQRHLLHFPHRNYHIRAPAYILAMRRIGAKEYKRFLSVKGFERELLYHDLELVGQLKLVPKLYADISLLISGHLKEDRLLVLTCSADEEKVLGALFDSALNTTRGLSVLTNVNHSLVRMINVASTKTEPFAVIFYGSYLNREVWLELLSSPHLRVLVLTSQQALDSNLLDLIQVNRGSLSVFSRKLVPMDLRARVCSFFTLCDKELSGSSSADGHVTSAAHVVEILKEGGRAYAGVRSVVASTAATGGVILMVQILGYFHSMFSGTLFLPVLTLPVYVAFLSIVAFGFLGPPDAGEDPLATGLIWTAFTNFFTGLAMGLPLFLLTAASLGPTVSMSSLYYSLSFNTVVLLTFVVYIKYAVGVHEGSHLLMALISLFCIGAHGLSLAFAYNDNEWPELAVFSSFPLTTAVGMIIYIFARMLLYMIRHGSVPSPEEDNDEGVTQGKR